MTFASRNLTLDAQSQQESHVKWTSLCIEPNAKSLKLFNPQSQPKMPSDSRATTLYPVGPRTRTMMQSCASAAKLRGGGPILHFGIEAKETRRDPATSNRHRRPVTSGRTRPKLLDAFGDFRS